MITASFPTTRLRRLRSHPYLRTLLQEHRLNPQELVLPLFIKAGEGENVPIPSMPGCYQLRLAHLPAEIARLQKIGVRAVILFGIPSSKQADGADSWLETGVIQQAIRLIKSQAPEWLVVTDVCLCEYTSHGHCGLIQSPANPLQSDIQVDNDATIALLARQALSHAQAGADMIAPSAMMDGMVTQIRSALDDNHFNHIPILSYAVKYASAFYGPFRQAAESAPERGDRRSYQMNPANSDEALREAQLDIQEGADILMVKPALPYLDIIHRVRETYPMIPVAAYQVSGEYAMLHAAANQGWLDLSATVMESLLAIKRAGASFIISYFTADVVQWLD